MKKHLDRVVLYIIYIFYVISSIFALIISLFIFMPLLNEYHLSNFAHQLTTSFPKNTIQIETKTRCGKLNGNGNGMDFLACVLIKSDLSLDTLKKSYNGMTFKKVKDEENHKVSIEILPVNSNVVKTKYLERDTISFDTLKNTLDYSNYYIVILYDGGYSADFDIRGH